MVARCSRWRWYTAVDAQVVEAAVERPYLCTGGRVCYDPSWQESQWILLREQGARLGSDLAKKKA
jgi:hypothetical protein